MNFVKYSEDTIRQFANYNFNQWFNIGLIVLISFIVGVVAN